MKEENMEKLQEQLKKEYIDFKLAEIEKNKNIFQKMYDRINNKFLTKIHSFLSRYSTGDQLFVFSVILMLLNALISCSLILKGWQSKNISIISQFVAFFILLTSYYSFDKYTKFKRNIINAINNKLKEEKNILNIIKKDKNFMNSYVNVNTINAAMKLFFKEYNMVFLTEMSSKGEKTIKYINLINKIERMTENKAELNEWEMIFSQLQDVKFKNKLSSIKTINIYKAFLNDDKKFVKSILDNKNIISNKTVLEKVYC